MLPDPGCWHDDGVGVALIAGTGSVAFGRAADGRTIRCGGWGYLLGDEGSGYAIGRAALRLAPRRFRSRPLTLNSPSPRCWLDELEAEPRPN